MGKIINCKPSYAYGDASTGEDTQITVGDGPSLDAFGRLRVSSPFAFSECKYKKIAWECRWLRQKTRK